MTSRSFCRRLAMPQLCMITVHGLQVKLDWAAVHDVPVALVTGTNGKTTTVRLTAAMLAAAGRTAGVTSNSSAMNSL